jgi:hypothetical protein
MENGTEEIILSPVALLESILFVASGPVPLQRLAVALETTTSAVNSLLNDLMMISPCSESSESRSYRSRFI